MKLINMLKSSLILSFITLFSFIGNTQEAAPKETAPVTLPIYEQLGISPTILFGIMLAISVLLVAALISMLNITKNVYFFKRMKNGKKAKMLLALLGFSFFASAASVESPLKPEYLVSFPDSAFWAFVIFDVIVLMIMLYFVGLVKGTMVDYAPEKKESKFWKRWNKTLTNPVAIEDEDSILLDHDYDGIKELDNDLPPWWKYGFYITIVWAVGYLAFYHVFKIGDLQGAEYIAEIKQQEKDVAAYKALNPNLVTEETVTLLTEGSDLAKGKKVFESNCVACHAINGGGGIGPNLTDKNWIYNGDIKGVFHTISEGANNGMASWKDLLSGDKMQAVASYVLSLPPAEGGKEPQGENIFE
ncbi:cbb3-type cytochrome c oxidase N-terminal domain-containing protein [Putridiphycobacter roseus]|nr:cbb3-type cytochrome c oxidase N-terminal domain-containing protein [Putridiphycobacter roseus]